MKFALHNSSFLPVSGNHEVIWPELKERVHWMEDSGFDYFSVMDHMGQIPGVGASDEPFLEAWMTLSALAATTKRINLLTLVSSLGYRNPALLVKMVTTLDLISNGRAILGIGGGLLLSEYLSYGFGRRADYPNPIDRLHQLREAIQIAKLMWRQPYSKFQGEYLYINAARLDPKPLQSPRPRILVGGGGEKVTLRIVAEEADMANFFVAGPRAFARKYGILKSYCDEVSRAIDEIEITALERLTLAGTTRKAEDKWKSRNLRNESNYKGLIGNPDKVISQIRDYWEMGAEAMFLMVPNADYETKSLFVKEVLPAFR